MTQPEPLPTAETIRVRGQVQGVGFRPFAWRLAARLGVAGEVRNDAEGVLIHAQGARLDAFARALREEAPKLARVDAVERAPCPARPGLTGFSIAASAGGAARTQATPDAALCPACRAEIADPADRRFRYAFANCTECGPRFSIMRAVPYDRATTTMAGFALCLACRAEYDDPADRRFHAQPVACPVCGPRLWLERDGAEVSGDAVAAAAAMLRDGAILAIKGLGGWQLACDARDEAAVARLRARKRRPAKPFALMAADAATVARFAAVSEAERALLESPAAPIVLLAAQGAALAPSVAPGQWALGWMLAATPLHALLLDAVGRPLVMTSGNLSGEPQVIGDDEARAKLGAFCDGFLAHDRPIARRLDDPVARVAAGAVRVLRRGRGMAPQTLPLPSDLAGAPPVAALGGQLKAALCLTRDGAALLSHHIGDLDEPSTCAEFDAALADYAALFDHAPAALACDLHPDHRTTRIAESWAERANLPLVRVQHHHAHIAAAMAEAGWTRADGPVLGVAFDGLGWGPDGTVWGGEWLLAGYSEFRRLAHLKPVPLPGGDAAQREPWRNLLAQLDAAGLGTEAEALAPGKPLRALRAAAARGVNAPRSSSAGRLFDAVAAACGLAPERLSFEGEAAMALEAAARRAPDLAPYPFGRDGAALDPAPMWRALLADRAAGAAPEAMAARFHAGLAQATATLARDLARAHGARAIALSGGVFQNATLLEATVAALAGEALLIPAQAPMNDGGLALGQAAVAAARALEGRL